MNKNILPILILVLVVSPFVLSSSKVSAATFSVTNTNTSGAGSLQQAIIDSNTTAGEDIISFNTLGVIDMANVVFPALSDSVVFSGPGIANLSIANTQIYSNSSSNLAKLEFNNLKFVNVEITATSVAGFRFLNNSISCLPSVATDQACVTLESSSNAIVQGNTVTGKINNQSGNSNTFNNNTATSIHVTSGNNQQITNNTTDDIYLNSTLNNTVTNNNLSKGLYISSLSQQNMIGSNTILGGIYVDGAGSNNISNNKLGDNVYVATNSNKNLISQNSFNTAQKPITLGGGNINISSPILNTATFNSNSNNTTVSGTVVAGSTIEFYIKSGNVYTYLSSFVESSTSDSNTNSANFSFDIVVPNTFNSTTDFIVATNTDSQNNTSQFSNQLTYNTPVTPLPPTPPVTPVTPPTQPTNPPVIPTTPTTPTTMVQNGGTTITPVVYSSQGGSPSTVRASQTQTEVSAQNKQITPDTTYHPLERGTEKTVESQSQSQSVQNPVKGSVLGVKDSVTSKSSTQSFDQTGSTTLIRTGGEMTDILQKVVQIATPVLSALTLGYLALKSNQEQKE